MRLNKILAGTSVAILLTIGFASESQYFSTFAQSVQTTKAPGVAVGPVRHDACLRSSSRFRSIRCQRPADIRW
jgi:hypothetical protein